MNKKKDLLYLEELTIPLIENEELILFDQTDKPFFFSYLIIFILGIFMTLAAV